MSEFVEVKTTELTNVALDWSVAKAEGYEIRRLAHRFLLRRDGPNAGFFYPAKAEGFRATAAGYWQPSLDWAQCGQLIEKHKVSVDARPLSGRWDAYCNGWVNDCETPLIAACRAIVASVLGDTVSVPKELMA